MTTPDYYAIKFTRASKKYLREALQIRLRHNPDKYVGYVVYVTANPFATSYYLCSPRDLMRVTYKVVSLNEFKQIAFIHLLER